MATKIQALDGSSGLETLSHTNHFPPSPKSETFPETDEVPQTDPFYYGYRTLIIDNKDGEPTFMYRPLTLADILDPEEGDVLMQGTLHYNDAEALYSIFEYLHRHSPTLSVYGDFKIIWGIEGLSNPAPDVVVIPNVKEPDKPRGEFDVIREGTHPTFILEVVSPRYRQADRTKKVDIYSRAGVKEYFIIDSHLSQKKESQQTVVNYEILGYRLEAGQYIEISPNEQGWRRAHTMY